MSRLIVASNRCSLPKQGSTPGGLVVALTAALRKTGGLWFGWNGKVVKTTPRRAAVEAVEGIRYATVPLVQTDYETYYLGYSNRVLWPLFHQRIDAVNYSQDFRNGYRRTNAFLGRKLVPLLKHDDVIWIHDYHLIPLARALREAGIKQRIGFFLHIPFPAFDVLRTLPHYRELLRDFSAYDLVGLQTENDCHNFLEAVTRGTNGLQRANDVIDWGERRSRAAAFPISIDLQEVGDKVARGRKSKTVRRLRESLHGRKLVVGVDRLDYSKGLPQRFEAYRRMLQRYPTMIGRVIFLQVAQPSREDVPEYYELRCSLERIVGDINGHFAEFDWVPLRYVNKSYSRETIMNFLSLADVGLVTPLRDGMNLVAKEFVAAQDPDDPGVLVLSELTGAAYELSSAIQVNPYDTDSVADALATALYMSLDERKERFAAAHRVIREHDVFDWAHSFTKRLQA